MAGAQGALPVAGPAGRAPGSIELDSPAANLAGFIRMMASLIDEDVPWWYNGTVYAVSGESQNPQPLFTFEGMELYRVAALPDGTYELTGNTVTFFRSLDGDWLRDYRNPLTGATNTVGAAVQARFGLPHFVFNNAGVGSGGLIWENTLADWEWVLGVNLMGVVHGIRVFTPMMLEAARADPAFEGHIVNTASMAGLVNPPNMGVYNASKHAVVAISETLYQDLRLVTEQIGASVLCPFFVPTGIVHSERNRPGELRNDAKPTKSQLISQAMGDKAVGSGKVSAAAVAQRVFDAMREQRFYIYSHPKALGSVQTRLEDVMLSRNPTDPFASKPELTERLREALRAPE